MDREQREIVSNYSVAMRQEMNALKDWAMGTDYFDKHLGKLESLARNCRQKIMEIEMQTRMEI